MEIMMSIQSELSKIKLNDLVVKNLLNKIPHTWNALIYSFLSIDMGLCDLMDLPHFLPKI